MILAQIFTILGNQNVYMWFFLNFSIKNRVPSWTDRILFSCIRFVGQAYGRIEVDVSDHKPVFLSGSVEVMNYLI